MFRRIQRVLGVKLYPFVAPIDSGANQDPVRICQVFSDNPRNSGVIVIMPEFDLTIPGYSYGLGGSRFKVKPPGEPLEDLFDFTTVASWWARATIYEASPDSCPKARKPAITWQSIGRGEEPHVEVIRRGENQLAKWFLPFLNIEKGFDREDGISILTMGFAESVTEKSLIEAHYFLAQQTRIRIEKQITRQIGDGEAARRILSAFAPDYER